MSGPVTRLIDIVFPTDVNHHGTLFGGVALSHMDKVAFIAASRHGRAAFVTAACERIDFAAPARQGEMVELDKLLDVSSAVLSPRLPPDAGL